MYKPQPLKVVFPFYHAVSDVELLHLKHLYPIKSEKAFRSDLDFFLKYYSPISLNDLYDAVYNSKPIQKPSFLLTFDDGFSQISNVVVPILKEKGIPAIFFLNTSFLNNKELFFRCKASLLIDKVLNTPDAFSIFKNHNTIKLNVIYSNSSLIKHIKLISYNNAIDLDTLAGKLNIDFNAYLENEKPYLTHNQIKQLIQDGFHIGSHSCDHPLFSDLDLGQQIKQVEKSMLTLKEQFEMPITSFSFPFTDFAVKADFFEQVHSSSHPILDFSFGTAGLKHDMPAQHFQRIPMEKFPYKANYIMLFQYFYWLLKAPFGKNKIVRV